VPFEGESEPPPKSKVGLYIGIGVVAAVVFAIIAVVVESRLERTKAEDLQRQEELARKVTEQRLRDAEEAAKIQAEASRKEMEIAILNAKKEAEAETRRSIQQQEELERAARAPGSLLVTTVPEGASVSIDNGPLLTTPVRAEGLAIGTHRVHIFLSGHDPVDLTAEIRAGKTTDLGAVPLSSIYGSMAVTSTPDNLEFTVRAVNNIMGKPVASGTTPGTIPSLAYGDYLVTFHRPGCRDHNENVTVERGTRATVNTVYQNGSLELASDPSGANVTRDGSFIGTTPLTLHDLTPKTASFQLDLPGYDPTPVSVEILEGQTVKFEAKVLRKDRIFSAKELKTPPTRTEGANPTLSASQREVGGSVLLSFVVRRNGSVSDVTVESTTDDDIARRCKNTVETWRYRPGTAPDDRVVDARVEVSFKFPPNS
jgi:TonB family protein